MLKIINIIFLLKLRNFKIKIKTTHYPLWPSFPEKDMDKEKISKGMATATSTTTQTTKFTIRPTTPTVPTSNGEGVEPYLQPQWNVFGKSLA